ncbi:hypothetical protein NLU13_6482 [Sarocladium strictum]|uniref:Probable alpha/beta-glucosidase agdC n=1 Tax=Sarocladium strictum TaxID=5046 RepID=A0AA39GFY9_SARSR|nr:hypothetical protein NLU13_6482 [Sarocladium strictum]
MAPCKMLGLALAASTVFGTLVPKNTVADRDVSACPGYTASNVDVSATGLTAELTLAGDPCDAYGEDLQDLTLEVTYESANRLHVKIQDQGNQVYQVPESVVPRPGGTTPDQESSNIRFSYTESPFSFNITRADTDELLFDTSAATIVFETQYLRLRTSIPSDPYLYGLGSHNDPMRLRSQDYIRTLWNQDSYGIPKGSNLYGSQPVYIDHRETGTHGVLFLNSNGMDIVIDEDESGGKYLEYNTLGGVLDFYFFLGDEPIDAIREYGEIVGRPPMQPYWGLGFHQCKYGYRDAFMVAEVVYNYSQANIPLEVMWTDIDYMDRRRVFTVDPDRFPLPKIRAVVDYLHEHDQQYIVMVDPAIAYVDSGTLNRGLEDDVFLLRANGSVWLGVVWPGVTVFPDWFAENMTKYWNNEFALFFDADQGVDIDGLWIDMNEPSNFPCNFPCDDPYTAARGYPPAAPPVREPPRELPGFPCVLQPEGTECDGGETAGSSKRDESRNESGFLMRPPGQLSLGTGLESRQETEGDQTGLPDRDLLYPEYAIHNKAAYQDSWNSDRGGISNRTVNTNVIHQNGLAEYDVHNIYGAMMSSASRDAMLARRPGLRPFIITRSTFPHTGSKVGLWLGDNLSNWGQYRESIRTMLAYTSIFQFGMVGSDVCGFGGSTNEELCARWASLGAFQTFFRNHAQFDARQQEFYQWASVAESARRAIGVRYRLLDYMYTALWRQSEDGTPAVVPMFYAYPKDKGTWELENQYFYGPGILVAPVLEQGSTSVDVYLPDGHVFYDWWTREAVQGQGGTYSVTDVNTTMIPLFIKGGVILPLRENSAMTTTELRKEKFELLVALDNDGQAKGELYLDDGESLEQESYTAVTLEYADGAVKLQGEFGGSWPVEVVRVVLLRPEGQEVVVDVGETFTEEGEIQVEEG